MTDELQRQLHSARAYLSACSEGLCKQDPVALLPLCLREIARNVNALAAQAERHLAMAEVPDDY